MRSGFQIQYKKNHWKCFQGKTKDWIKQEEENKMQQWFPVVFCCAACGCKQRLLYLYLENSTSLTKNIHHKYFPSFWVLSSLATKITSIPRHAFKRWWHIFPCFFLIFFFYKLNILSLFPRIISNCCLKKNMP